jgi:hypothetical protein
MISHTRYNQIRERIFFLYNIINNRAFPMWIAPKTLMDIEQLRERYESKQEGYANDAGYFDNHQIRKMTCPQIIDILPNLTGADDLGFNNANKVVPEIYESIQEYLMLWCEITTNAPEFPTPPMQELRWLESLAWYLFPMYRRIKPFVLDDDVEKAMTTEKALNKSGLTGLSMLFSFSKQKGEISFVSHLDGLQDKSDFVSVDEFMAERPTMTPSAVMDSLSQLESAPSHSEWIFKG